MLKGLKVKKLKGFMEINNGKTPRFRHFNNVNPF